MKLLFFLCFILSQSLAAELLRVEVKAQSLCPMCAVHAQQILSPIMSPQIQPTSILFINNNNPSIVELESIATRSLIRDLSKRSALGLQLASLSLGTKYQLYYQISIDSEGKSSLFNSQNLPTYEVEQRHPYELWGFFHVIKNRPYILLNEHQHPWNAWSTIVHELFHLHDFKAQQWIAKKNKSQESWSILDDLAIEFRALLAEVMFRREIKQSAAIMRTEPLLKDDYKDRFIEAGNIQLEALAHHTMNLFYPRLVVANRLQLDPNQKAEAMDFSFSPRLREFWKNQAPQTILSQGILSTAIWFMQEALVNQLNSAQLPFSALILRYRNFTASEILSASVRKREEIDSLIQKSGSKSFFEHLKKIGFADEEELRSGLQLSPTINQIPGKSGGPSPRINGGG